MDVDNCVDVLTIAETYSLSLLTRKVLRFISENLLALSSKFHRLSGDQIEQLLDCDFPLDIPEYQVLEMVIDWLRCHSNSDCKSLLTKINYQEIETGDLEQYSGSKYDKYISTYAELRVNDVFRRSDRRKQLINSRGMNLALIKVGGFGSRGVTNDISYCLDPQGGEWRHLTVIPHVECCNFGIVTLANELFVVGGCFNQSLQEHIHPFGFRYNPRHDRWSTLCPMKRERCRFTLSVIGRRLYAVGGNSEAVNNVDVISGEKYDPDQDSWSTISAIPTDDGHCSQHAAVDWNDRWLFLSGGLDSDSDVQNNMLAYDTENDKWEHRSPMPTPRADHSMLVHQDKIYVVGGWFEQVQQQTRVLVQDIHVYDIFSDTWSTETKVPTPRLHSGVTLYHSKLYVIGGFHSDVLFDRATGMYDKTLVFFS